MNASYSIFVFGIYMLLEGAVLLFLPQMLLSLFGIQEGPYAWIRLLGLALMVLGFYYIQAAKQHFKPFFHWTIPIRITQFFVVSALVYLGEVPTFLLFFSSVEALAGLWTWWLLQK